jgi:exoribonuclease R
MIVADKQGKLSLFDGTNYLPVPEEHYDKIYGQNIDTKECVINTFLCIIHFSSSYTFTIQGKKDIILKRSTSLIHQFPEIRTKTKNLKQKNDMYAIVKIEKIEKGIMFCEVVSYLGETNDIGIESKLMELVCTAHWKNTKKMMQQFAELKNQDLTPIRDDMTKLTIYSIDPPGCVDIDDALHYQYYDEVKEHEIGIHIADVSSFIPENSVCDIELKSRVETVYAPNTRIDMIPSELSIEHISLLEKKSKRAFSVILRLNQDNEIIRVEFKKTLISVAQNLTYDKAQEMASSDENIKNLYEFGKILKQKIIGSFSNDKPYDTHQMVEVYMIYANKLSGEKIQSVEPDNVLLRIHTGEHTELKFNAKNIDPVLLEKNRVSGMEQARYQIGTQNCKHIGLDLSYYTHMTSPIRRYADIIVHRQLWKIINKEQLQKPGIETIFAMNFYKNLFKQMGRYMKLYEISYHLGSECHESEAYIVSINDDRESVRIFVPEYDFEYDLQLVNHRMRHIINVKIVDQKITLINEQECTEKSYCLFQKIGIKMISSREPFVKLRFEIIS